MKLFQKWCPTRNQMQAVQFGELVIVNEVLWIVQLQFYQLLKCQCSVYLKYQGGLWASFRVSTFERL